MSGDQSAAAIRTLDWAIGNLWSDEVPESYECDATGMTPRQALDLLDERAAKTIAALWRGEEFCSSAEYVNPVVVADMFRYCRHVFTEGIEDAELDGASTLIGELLVYDYAKRMKPRSIWQQRYRVNHWRRAWVKSLYGRGPVMPPLTEQELEQVHDYLRQKWGV